MTPHKPVNLLPEVPTNQSRKLTEREQRDCEVIGKYWHKYVSNAISKISSFKSNNKLCFSLFRAANQILLLHRAQEHPRLRTQGHNAFPRQLHQRPAPVVPRLLALQGRPDRHAPLRVGAHRVAAEGGRGNAHGASEGVADYQRDPRNARLVKERTFIDCLFRMPPFLKAAPCRSQSRM